MPSGRTIAPALLSILVFAACGAASAHIFPPGYKPAPSSVPAKTCGNGVVDPGEACDDGARNGDAAACSTSCRSQVAYCSIDDRGLPVCGPTPPAAGAAAFVGKDGIARCEAVCTSVVYCCSPREGYACVAQSVKAGEWSPCLGVTYDGRTHPSQDACDAACQGRHYCVQGGGGAQDVGCTNEPVYDPGRGAEVYPPYTETSGSPCPAGEPGCLAKKASKEGWKSLYDCRRLDPACAAAARSSSSRRITSASFSSAPESRFTMSRASAPEGTREHVCNVGGVLCTASTDMCPPLHDVECEQPLSDGRTLLCTPQKLCVGAECVLCPASRCVSTVDATVTDVCRCRCIPQKIRGSSASSVTGGDSRMSASAEAERFMPSDTVMPSEEGSPLGTFIAFAAGGGLVGAGAFLWWRRRREI